MFTPAIKYAIRIGLIVVITTAILAVFVGVQVPAIDFTPISSALGTLFAILYHYVPVMSIIIPFIGVLLGVRLALLGWKFASIAIKWIWKVNE